MAPATKRSAGRTFAQFSRHFQVLATYCGVVFFRAPAGAPLGSPTWRPCGHDDFAVRVHENVQHGMGVLPIRYASLAAIRRYARLQSPVTPIERRNDRCALVNWVGATWLGSARFPFHFFRGDIHGQTNSHKETCECLREMFAAGRAQPQSLAHRCDKGLHLVKRRGLDLMEVD
jgi:hypothetical protein